RARDGQAASSQRARTSGPASRHAGDTISSRTDGGLCQSRYETIVRRPAAQKRSIARAPGVVRIPLGIGHDAGWRNGTDPATCTLPRQLGLRIVHGDGPVVFDNAAAAFAHLPFQAGAGQTFAGGALPDEAPEVFVAPSPFTRLNPARHRLELRPCSGRL